MNSRIVIISLLVVLAVVLGASIYEIPILAWGPSGPTAHPLSTEFIRAFAVLMFGAIGTSLISEALLRKQLQREMIQTLTRVLRKERKNGDAIVQFGLETIRDPFKIGSIVDSLRDGETLWWLDTYDSTSGTWINRLDRAAKTHKVKANFLVLDSTSPIAEMRARELAEGKHTSEKEAISHFVSSLEQFHTMIDDRKHKYPGVVDVRRYSNLPCAPMYIVAKDDKFVRGYSSYFLLNETNHSPHFEWTASQVDKALGSQLLDYVRHKWNVAGKENSKTGPGLDVRTSQFPVHNPCGYWIYMFALEKSDRRVYGKFFVYESGRERFRADGEAFYFGKRPDRVDRRGIWRATDIQFRPAEAKFELSYDMVIQNAIQGIDAGNHYRGRLDLHHTDGDPEFKFSGNIYAIRGSARLIGNAVVMRVRSAAEIPSGQTFVKNLRNLFKTYLDEDPYPVEGTPAPPHVV